MIDSFVKNESTFYGRIYLCAGFYARGVRMKRRMAVLLTLIILIFSQATALAAYAERSPSGIPLQEIEGLVDEHVSSYIGVTSPGVAVVVVKDGEILFSKGYGYADMENKVPVDPEKTVFEYGSVSKLFVYTTIMRLVEEGRLDLHTDIRWYLPDGFLKNLRYHEPITLLHVMNHTTGFEDFLFDVILTSPDIRPGFEETLRTSQPQQVYRPGTVSAYSNYAVGLAAYIAQGVIGQEFHEYLLDSIFLPIDMDHTSAHPTLEDKPWLAQNNAMGYAPLADGTFKKGAWSYIPLYPVGSVNGTAKDLAYFALALMPPEGQNSPLFQNRETLNEMLSQSHAMGPGLTGFAHGFVEYDGPYRGVGHGGNTAYFTAQMNIVPEKRFGVVVLANAASEMDLTEGLTKVLLGEKQEEALPYEGVLPDAGDVEGTYISARRAHHGFLKLYAYLSLLRVRAVEPDTIEMHFAGQSAKLVQTAPYVFKQIEADGAIFEYHFNTVYFEMEEGTVQRVSGDFLPLPSGHTIPWLWIHGIIAAFSALFFLLSPVICLITARLRQKNSLQKPSLIPRAKKIYVAFVLCGTGLVINNAILILRMLANNYRSFTEVRVHVLLNYPITAVATVLTVMIALSLKRSQTSKKQLLLWAVSTILLGLLVWLLVKWGFFEVLA
jgi:CubicO group peptidase (beta-lactamase class C family)